MARTLRLLTLALLVAALSVLAACGSDDDEDSGDSASTTTTEQGPACAKGQLALTTPGRLTSATDKPAFPPYFEDDDPTNGKGFESAVAYAIGRHLGYPPAKVNWTVE